MSTATRRPLGPVDLAVIGFAGELRQGGVRQAIADAVDRGAVRVLDVLLVAIAQNLMDLTRRDSAIFLLLLAYHVGFWTWKGTTVPLDCDNAFVYDLQVTKESTVD